MALTISSTLKLNSGHSIPLLGFGVYQTSGKECHDSCVEALKAGYRHIDSAQMYKNENEVGRAIKASGLKREAVFITTKVRSGFHGYEKSKRGVEASLQKLETDYIDLFLIHSATGRRQARLDTWRGLEDKFKEGKIQSIGVSNYNVKHLEELRASGIQTVPVAINQIELHPWCQQKPIVEYCQQNGIAVQAYCPIVRGEKWGHPVLKSIADKHNNLESQVLIRWSLQRGFIPLPKSVTPSRILSNSQLYDFELDSEDMERLNGLDEGGKGAVSWNPVECD